MKMGLTHCPETSVNTYHMTQHDIPEERRSYSETCLKTEAGQSINPSIVPDVYSQGPVVRNSTKPPLMDVNEKPRQNWKKGDRA
jgi:hypothetical protein